MRAIVLAAALVAFPAAAQQLPPQNAQSIWRSEAGAMEHLQSGLVCAERLGGMTRQAATTYHPFGLDVSCGWNLSNAAITVYLTYGLGTDANFANAKQALAANAAFRGVQIVSDGHASQGGLDWRRAVYAVDGMKSEVWVTDLHGWSLKYRVTYPDAAAADVASALEAVTAEVRRTAGPQLAACARSAVPVRKGRAERAQQGKEAGMVSALMGGVAAAAAQKAAPREAARIVYCPEEALMSGGKPFLFWRGVRLDGSDAQVDRLTAMTTGPPPVMTISRDELGGLISAEMNRKPPTERWVATLQDAGRTSIFAHYAGRPSGKTVASLMTRIAGGKAQPLSSYSFDGKTVTIGVPTK